MLPAPACAPDLSELRDGYGLRPMELKLTELNRAQVLHGGDEHAPVAAELRVAEESIPGRLSLSGQGTLTEPKKSYRFEAATDSRQLPGRSLKFSAQAQDASFTRSLLGARIYREAGSPTPAVEPVALYLNGELQGLYLLIERIDREFYRRRGQDPERIYEGRLLRSDFGPRMLADPERGFEASFGSFHAPEIRRAAEWANAPAADESTDSDEDADAPINLPSAIAYFGASFFGLNCDAFNNNIYLYKTRDEARLGFTPWDWERVLAGTCTADQQARLNFVAARLVASPSLRPRLVDKVRELRATFPPDRIAALLQEDAARVRAAYLADPFLGGSGKNPDEELRKVLDAARSSENSVRALLPEAY